jgi:EAL domain-containing protein (putative c-di-GMP-specific phosphodiesterase class I)
VRWPHAARGLIPPAEFVPLAEQAGLMRQLTTRVLGAAIAQAARWRAAGRTLTIAVNVSATDLMDARFPDELERALRAHGVPADALRLEVTEDMVMSDPERALDVLARLSEIGVAHNLGLRVVAEGVEHEATWAALADMGAQYAQGYFLTAPLFAPEIERWLEEWNAGGGQAVGARSTTR